MRDFIEKIKVKTYEKNIPIKDLAKRIKESKEDPTLFNIEGFNFPTISGLFGDRDRVASALGVNKTQIVETILEKLENLKKYTLIDNAPFMANEINVDKDTNLESYIPLIDFYGGKKYTTSSIVIVNFPGEDRQNLSFHRMMYLGGNRFSIRIVAQRHLDKAYITAMERNQELQIAVVFGVHPAIELSASFSAPRLDELELAAAFLDGLTVVELPNDVLVPSHAEFVMIGRITKEMADEGPFVDLTGTADIVRQQPVLEIDKLYHRNDPIFRTILPGGNEHRMLMGIPQEPRMYNSISNTISTIKNVILTQGGNCWLHAIVQIKKRTEGDAKNAIMAAFSAHPSLKRVIIIDEDVDINDPDDIEWAIATRVQPDKDLLLIPKSKGSSLDPSSENSITCKWGIDATKPLKDNEGYNKVEY